MTDFKHIQNTVQKLSTLKTTKEAPLLFGGADGAIDEIIHVVDKRYDAHTFDPIRTISDYAARLAEAAGKSTNIEFYVNQVKAGGNGPLLCEAWGRLGGRINYIGCLGANGVDPLFSHLEQWGQATSIAAPPVTLATEFEDGKIMHGKHQTLALVTWKTFLEGCGGEEGLDQMLAQCDLFSLINWVMVPHLTEVIEGVLGRLKNLGDKAPKYCFFDLCDPEKRTKEDLCEALLLMGQYKQYIENNILGLNEKESLEVCKALDLTPGEGTPEGLISRAKAISEKTGISEVVIHPVHCAAVWTASDQGSFQGPTCKKPALTTGAGDHFNGAYIYARVMGLSPSEAIIIGKSVSGFYVRQGRGPSAEEVAVLAERWENGSLDPWERI